MTYTYQQLVKLPLFRPARIVKGEKRETPYGPGRAILKFGDECGNGHNMFSITVDGGERFVGCCHDFISTHWPEYAHLIKWHLCSTNGPMHYIANTVYHATAISPHQNQWYLYLDNRPIEIVGKKGRLEAIKKYGKNAQFKEYLNPLAKDASIDMARVTAVAPDATLEQLRDKQWLRNRLPALLDQFAQDIQQTFKTK
jgi:post-segregation antitoxin (ccd killing protein)